MKCYKCDNEATEFWSVRYAYSPKDDPYTLDLCTSHGHGLNPTDSWVKFDSHEQRDSFHIDRLL